ncbi:hypothetical protein HK405_014055 [Cladochytrium tenue]|nr:hypothetical protein HK405_014055 [Cladochytrium tenue]
MQPPSPPPAPLQTPPGKKQQSAPQQQQKQQPILGTHSVDVATIRASLSPVVAAVLKDFPSLITLPVQWGEMDSFGHLNNVVYARYFETGRMTFMQQVMQPRLPVAEFARFSTGRGGGASMILGSVTVRYRAPVTFPDTLTVGVRVARAKVGVDRFVLDFAAVSHRLGKVVADGDAVQVVYDYGKKSKVAIPDSIRNVLLENSY